MINMPIKKSKSFCANLHYVGITLCLMFAQQTFAANVLENVKTNNQADGKTTITLQFAEPVGDIKSFTTESPPRIAFDLPDTSNALAQKNINLDSSLAKSISAAEAGGRTRVVVDLVKNSTYKTQAVGNTLVLTIDDKLSMNNSVSIDAIDFKKSQDGAGRLIVRFDSIGAKTVLKDNGTEVVIDIDNAQLPADLRRKMDVTGFSTPVLNVDARDNNGKTRLVINTKGATAMMAYQTGNEYVVEISSKNSIAKSDSKSNLANTGAISSGANTKSFSGKPVTFNFQDVPVRTVLQLIAEESNLNIVAADTVSGNVTLRLINVPWDQALDIVLLSKGLDKRKDGNVIWVGPQAEIAAYELAREDARIALTIRQETVTEYIAVNYGNAESIAKLLTENSKAGGSSGGSGGGGGGGSASVGGVSLGIASGFLSPRGSVSFDTRTNTLLVIDIPKKIAEIKQMMLILDRPVDQVMIEARVVIAVDTFLRELGSRFGIIDSDQSVTPVSTNAGLFASNLLSNPAGILNFNFFGNNTSLDIELQAMENNGQGEVVSNPRVITANQVEATIKQGEEIAYVTQQPSVDGNVPQATVEFKDVLLELKVTPTITQDGRVFMKIYVKKDEVNGVIRGPTGDIPQIAKREVNTAVLVSNGQTVVIGGVYEFKDRKDVNKVPWLGDIPFLGYLFKTTKKELRKSELLIFVTPRILKPSKRVE